MEDVRLRIPATKQTLGDGWIGKQEMCLLALSAGKSAWPHPEMMILRQRAEFPGRVGIGAKKGYKRVNRTDSRFWLRMGSAVQNVIHQKEDATPFPSTRRDLSLSSQALKK